MEQKPPSMKNNFNYFKRFYRFVFFSVFSFFVFSSCSQDELTENNTVEQVESSNLKTLGNLTLQKNVIILDDESVTAISAIDNQQITFSQPTHQTSDIKTGSILVGTKVEGDRVRTILSKVTAISNSNNKYFVQTTSAQLEEFIYSGTLSGVYDPSGKPPIDVNGKLVNYIPVEGFISEELNNKILRIEAKNLNDQKLITFNRLSFDKTFPLTQQAGPVTLASSVNVKGGVTPKIDYSITFSWGHLTDFSVNLIMDDITLQSTANIQGTLGYTISLTDYLNIPIAPVVLGPTGLILSPTVSAGPFLGVGTTGKVQVRFPDIGGTASFLIAKKPALHIDLSKKSDISLTSLEGNLSAEIGLEAKGAIGLQFITVPIANSGLRGRVSALSTLGLQLIPEKKGIFDVKGRVQADMFYGFGIAPLRYEGTIPLFQKELPLYHKEFVF